MSQSTESTPAAAGSPSAGKTRELSGRAVVIGMLALGIFSTSLLFVYFELHTRPFRPLREAIGREFRHSRPNVEGGRVKGRGPMILRISMSVPFDPFKEDEKCGDITRRLLEIARQYHDLATFEQVQINLIYFAPETEAKRRTFDFPGKPAE